MTKILMSIKYKCREDSIEDIKSDVTNSGWKTRQRETQTQMDNTRMNTRKWDLNTDTNNQSTFFLNWVPGYLLRDRVREGAAFNMSGYRQHKY